MFDKSLRLVVLDRIYDLWDDPVAQELFQDLVALKRVGFGKEYGYGVLPVDSHDLTSTHFAIVEEREGRMTPLMAARVTTLDRCRLFNLPFPALQLCAMAAAPYHGSAFHQMIDQCAVSGRKISYWGLWTIRPDVREQQGLSTFLVKCLGGMGHLLAEEMGVTDQILGATLRFKVDRTGRSWGFEPMLLDGVPLPPLEVAHLLSEPVLLMHQTKPTDTARKLMEEMRAMWDRRIVLAPGGKVSNEPPAGAKVKTSLPGLKGVAPALPATSTYLPSLLYARERYGALPDVPSRRYVDYLKALMTIAGSDGELSPAEWCAIRDLVHKLGLHEKVIQELQQFDWRNADLKAVFEPLGGSDMGRRMLYDAVRIAHEDGFAHDEYAAVNAAAAKLDIPQSVVDSIVELVKSEIAIRKHRADVLFPERLTADGTTLPSLPTAAVLMGTKAA